MKVGVLAFGTQGDVQPYLALGAELVRAGHEVRLVTHEGYEQAASALGLEWRMVQGNVQQVVNSPELRELLRQGNFLKINALTSKLVAEVSVEWLRVGLDALHDRDLLLAGIGGLHPARALSQKLRIPLVEAHVVPFTPTREFPAPLFPTLTGGFVAGRFAGGLNRLTHRLFQQVMWQGYRAADTNTRKVVLNLPPAPLLGSSGWQGRGQPPVLYGLSPSVLRRPADWPAHVHLTGYWLLDQQPNNPPPAALQAFLDAGPPPVYIGFGSMGHADPQQTTDLILSALERTEQRAVLLEGWGGLLPGDPPQNVFLSGPVPHSWLFPRMSGLIHHGGAGTTAAALRSGVPSAVVPFFGDQPFWGRKVQELGVGPAPRPRKTLTAAQLAQAIQQVTSDQRLRDNAARLGEAIRREDGLGKARRIIERFVRSGEVTP